MDQDVGGSVRRRGSRRMKETFNPQPKENGEEATCRENLQEVEEASG